MKFGDTNSLLGATIAAFTPPTATRVLGTTGHGRRDRREGRLRRVAGRGRRATSAPRCRPTRHGERRGDHRRSDHHQESQNDSRTTSRSSTRSCSSSASSRCSSGRSSSSTRSRSSSPSAAASWRCCARSVPGSARCSARCCSRRCSSASSRRSSASSPASCSPAGLKALLGALGLDIPASDDRDPRQRDHLVVRRSAWSSPSSPRSRRRSRASRIPPIAAMRDVGDRPLEHVAARIRVRHASSRSSASALLLLGPVRRQRPALRRRRHGRRVPRRRGPRPDDRRADQRRARHRRSRRSRASPACSRARTRCATRSARRPPPPRSMIGVALVGLITVFAASARTSVERGDRPVDEGRLRRSRRPGFGQGSDPARGAAARCGAARGRRRRRASAAARRRSTARSTQVIAADPAKIDSLFDLEPTQGKISRPRRRTASRCSTAPPSDNGWKLGQTGPDRRSRRPARSSSRSRRSTRRPGFTNYVITTDAYEKNFTDQFDFQVYVSTKGGVTPGEHRRDQEGRCSQYPGPKVADPRRVQGHAGRADQPVPEPGLRAAVLRHRHRAVRHRQHARPVDHRAHATSSACCARSA